MKAGSKNIFAEKFYNDLMGTLKDNLVKEMIVLHDEFGFGEKRMNRFLDAIVKKTAEFDKLIAEGVLEMKTDYERQTYNNQISEIVKSESKRILPVNVHNTIYTIHGTRNESVADYKAKERSRNKIDVKQVAHLQEFMHSVRANAGERN